MGASCSSSSPVSFVRSFRPQESNSGQATNCLRLPGRCQFQSKSIFSIAVVVLVLADFCKPSHAGQWIRPLSMTCRISSYRNIQAVRLHSFRVLFSFWALSPRLSLVRVHSEFPPGLRGPSPERFQQSRDARVFSCGFLIRRRSGMTCCIHCMGNSPNYPRCRFTFFT